MLTNLSVSLFDFLHKTADQATEEPSKFAEGEPLVTSF
jgi:hypothetical protein